MVVAEGQFSVLTVKTVVAEIISSRGADAIASPVAVGKNKSMKGRIVGINAAALSHSHMVGRIEARGTDIAPGARKTGLAVDSVLSTERVAVVLDEPKSVLVAELLDRAKIEGIS